MPLFISGSNGISGADGTAALPAVQGTDGNTGIFFPAADQVAIATGGVQRLLVDASGNVVVAGSSLYPLVQGTAVASTSGTAIDFTGIPSWARRITVLFNGVSTNGSAVIQVQLGTSSGVVTTGYSVQSWQSNTANASATTGFAFGSSSTSGVSITGLLTLVLLSANTFVGSGSVGRPSPGSDTIVLNGSIALSGALDRVRITTVGGTDTFDAGSINILYE